VDAVLTYDDSRDGPAWLVSDPVDAAPRLRQLPEDGPLLVEYTRLFEPAQRPAVHEECNRPARDLHDAVTQALFSMTLIAQALPRILARDPDRTVERIARLHELGRGALAEMGALLVHLRPTAPAEQGCGGGVASDRPVRAAPDVSQI
jgi:signal transduction histidine kinase